MRRIAVLLVLICASVADAQSPPQPGFYFDTQLLWFDSPMEGQMAAFPKLVDEEGISELAPRFILGYDDRVGARVRWWTYDRERTIPLDGYFDRLRLKFDVVDLEATTHLRYELSDFLFSGGARIAVVQFSELLIPQDSLLYTETTMGGLTFAGEGRTSIYCNGLWGTAFVYGGRLSVLEADWEGDSDSVSLIADQNIKDERFIVPEVFAGIEAHYGRAFTRLTVEMQDWRGNAETIHGDNLHNFGFTGVGLDLGVVY